MQTFQDVDLGHAGIISFNLPQYFRVYSNGVERRSAYQQDSLPRGPKGTAILFEILVADLGDAKMMQSGYGQKYLSLTGRMRLI